MRDERLRLKAADGTTKLPASTGAEGRNDAAATTVSPGTHVHGFTCDSSISGQVDS